MKLKNLYKFSFSDGFSTVAIVIACSNQDIECNDTIKSIANEVAVNYCEDNHYSYDREIVNNFINNVVVKKIGTLIPEDEDYYDEDYVIISLHKTKNWGK